MAIYSFNHDSFGKTTNRAGAAGGNAAYNARETETRLDHSRQDGTAAGNAAYNAREEATYAVRSHVIPPEPGQAEAWFREQEKADRKNARMSDRFIGALPRELTPEQCIEAIERFCSDITQDRIPWHFALHLELDKKNEADWNPHAHIIFRDRDIETGRRFLYTSAHPKERAQLSEKGIHAWTTQDFRIAWEGEMNRALERAGHEARIDHRNLKEQGIDREPQIHVGPGSQNAAKKGRQFESRDREIGDRVIAYSVLDQGSRAEHNAHIVDANKQREAIQRDGTLAAPRQNDKDPEMARLRAAQAEARRAMYQDQRRDRDALKVAQNPARIEHKKWARQLYAGARQAAYKMVKESHADKWKEVRAIKDREERGQAAGTLKVEQKKAYDKEAERQVKLCRPQKDAAWKAMSAEHKKERGELRDQHRQETEALARQHAAERLGMEEKRRAEHIEKRANRISARLSSRQDMASQQAAAHQAIKLHAKASKTNGYRVQNVNPREASRAYFKTAWAEGKRQGDIRQALLEKRAANLKRAGPNGQDSYHRQQIRRSLRLAPVNDNSTGQGYPRDIIAPGLQAAKGKTGSDIQRSLLENDAQNQIRQAAMTGRTLNDAERVNAPPDIRQRLSDRERTALAIRNLTTSGPAREDRSKGRGGGGRGR